MSVIDASRARPWTDQEDRIMRDVLQNGGLPIDVARALDRSPGLICKKMKQAGLSVDRLAAHLRRQRSMQEAHKRNKARRSLRPRIAPKQKEDFSLEDESTSPDFDPLLEALRRVGRGLE